MDDSVARLLLIALVVVSAVGLVIALLYPYLTGQADMAKRIDSRVVGKVDRPSFFSAISARLAADSRDTRRKQIQDSLKQLDQARRNQKRASIRTMISQSGLDIPPRSFWIGSIVTGLVVGLGVLILGAPVYIVALAIVAGTLGLPRWFLGFMRRRRETAFLREFADAIDVMVRSLKSGLPVADAMRIIASETPAPVGPEFLELVEGQRVGITLDQGLDRMYERIPLAEVNFLAVVIAIQMQTGGNLSEALSNLSRVLRDRKKMKLKIKAVSQEAKSSAMIIGALPFVICGGMALLSPGYLDPLFTTGIGNILLVGCLIWMATGIFVMRGMINFDI
jgi:tight adherence protein B